MNRPLRLFFLPLLALATDAAPPPNVVVVLTDDQGWGDLAVHGHPFIRTPHLDAMAAEGVRFDRFYVSPVCAPTRAALLTGRWYPRTGVRGVTRAEERMRPSETTLAELLGPAGYATGAFGKWHNGSPFPFHPNGQGFGTFRGFCCGHWGTYIDPELEHNGRPYRAEGYVNDVFTDAALGFIEEHRDQPFFAWLAFNTPHSPMVVPDPWHAEAVTRAEAHERETGKTLKQHDHTIAALAMVEHIDHQMGRLFAKLRELEIEDRTLVVFLSDNGPNGDRWRNGLKGRKGSVDEGGVRVPCLMRWPGRLPAGSVVHQPVHAIDLLPTVCAFSGLEPPAGVDGRDLGPLLADPAAAWEDRPLFAAWGRRPPSVRTRRWFAAQGQLFDLLVDPGQRENLIADHPGVHADLLKQLEAWRAEVFAGGPSPLVTPIGHPDFPFTRVPAQDAVLEGQGWSYSSRHPNAAWLATWDQPEQGVHWDLDVATAGSYRLTLRYTCPEPQLGSRVRVSLGDQVRELVVDRAYDPPTYDPHDRVPRSESLDKPFAALPAGTFQLPAGRVRLSLRAIDIPAGHVMDLRAVDIEGPGLP